MEQNNCCCRKTRQRTGEEYRSLVHRLNRIEGQVRGVRKMVESDAYCTDILVQVSAVSAALNAFSRELLGQHIRTCVAEDIKNGKDGSHRRADRDSAEADEIKIQKKRR